MAEPFKFIVRLDLGVTLSFACTWLQVVLSVMFVDVY